MWPDVPATDELLQKAREGEAGAVDRLLDAHREALRRAIGLRLDPGLAGRVDASDVVQEVLLEASQRLTDYLRNPVMPFPLWLRHIARDHIIDTHRRHHALRRNLDRERPIVPAALADHSSMELAGQLIDREQTPATAALRQELARRLREAVSQLDETDREVILMRHFEQLSNQDVASMLELTEAAASMRYLRALRRLRALLVSDAESQP